jgi:hypothetical protein
MSHNRSPHMVMLAFSLLTALSFELVHSRRSAASEAPKEGAPRTPVLVELFTSEGCSSCPPADVLLGQLDRLQPVPAAELIVLSEHVDYWDDIGWKDPYSSHQFGLRQSDYARRFRLDGPYTPQMIVDGDAQLVGSDERDAFRAIGNAVKLAKLPVSLSAHHVQGDKSLLVHVDVKPVGSLSGHKSGHVLVALADDSDQSSVRRGENAGRTLKHVAVVRTLTSVGTIDDSGAFSKDVTVSTGEANLQNLRVVAFVQDGTSGRVLGVGTTRLSNKPLPTNRGNT